MEEPARFSGLIDQKFLRTRMWRDIELERKKRVLACWPLHILCYGICAYSDTDRARKKEKHCLQFEKAPLKENCLAVWRKGRQQEMPAVSMKRLGILK